MNEKVARLQLWITEHRYRAEDAFWNGVMRLGTFLIGAAKGHVRQTYYESSDRYDRTRDDWR